MATNINLFKTARMELDALHKQRNELAALIETKGARDQISDQRLRLLDDSIRIKGEYCSVLLLESNTELLQASNRLLGSLEFETRKLKWLTIGLMTLTGVLILLAALSVYKAFL